MVDRFKRLAPLSGIVMVAVTVVALALGSSPETKDSAARVVQWYHNHHDAAIAQSVLLAYAGALAVLFFTSVAAYLRRCGAQVLAMTMVIGGGIMAAGFMLGAGLNYALTDHTRSLSPGAAQALNYLQDDAFGFMLFAGLLVAMLSMGVAMLRTNSYPKALGIISVIVGIGAGTVVVSWFAFMATGLVTLVVAGYTYHYLGRPDEIVLPAEIPAARTSEETTPRSRSRTKA